MSSTKRDEFPPKVIAVVGERVAYTCSRPDCRSIAIGPHSEAGKSLKTGRACHIRGAAPNGPRYDALQTKEQRKSIENAIWLCGQCSDIVDKDESKHPPELLLMWKQETEAWIQGNAIIPKLPVITLSTNAGFTMPSEGPYEVDLSKLTPFKEHHLTIENPNDVILHNLNGRVQFPIPEGVVSWALVDGPAGVAVIVRGHRLEMTAIGQMLVSRAGPSGPNPNMTIKVDRLPARHSLKIRFITQKSASIEGLGLDQLFAVLPADFQAGKKHWVKIDYQYERKGIYLSHTAFSELTYEKSARFMRALPVRDDMDTLQIQDSSFDG